MPVPSSESAAPRRLLRDVVYSQIRAEILNGQLEPGEQLNDDSLTTWLGVSRTPIREALSKLASDGLIDMEANRYTRVPMRSPEAYARAAEYMHMIRGFILQHLDRVPSSELTQSRKAMGKLLPKLRNHDRTAQVAFNEEFGELAALVGNPLVAEAEQRVRNQAQFHLLDESSVINWDNILEHAEALAG
jgi:DNA-binding GntR family transcriptional regulator